MPAKDNLAMVKELLDAMRRHDIKKGTSYYAEDCLVDIIALREVVRGRAGLASAWSMAWTAFPDQYYEEKNMFAQDDWVVFEGILGGTQTGRYLGFPPTGKHIAYRVAFIWRIEGGKVKEWHSYWDAADLLRQLGVIPENTSLPFRES
jgi:steroid delta-isomerase-like uncharacterized protein